MTYLARVAIMLLDPAKNVLIIIEAKVFCSVLGGPDIGDDNQIRPIDFEFTK